MIRQVLALTAGILAAAPAASAEPQWGGTVTLASNHLLRGVSRSSNDPSLSAELHVQSARGWFAGAWAATSRVRESYSTTAEVAATLGFSHTLRRDWRLAASLSHYESPWQEPDGYYRYDEATLDLRFRDTLLLSASFSPNTSAYSPTYGPVQHRNVWAWEATYQRSLVPNLRAHLGAGYHDLSAHFGEGYWYGSAGLGWNRRRWQFDLSYVHPGGAARRLSYEGTARRRLLATAGFTF